MFIDKVSLLFINLSDDEVKEIQKVCEDIVLRGDIPYPYPDWLENWMQAGEFNDSQRLLVISTVFPQRALLSIIGKNDKEMLDRYYINRK